MDNSGFKRPNSKALSGNAAVESDDWVRPVTRQSAVIADAQIAPPSSTSANSKIIDLARPGFRLPSQAYLHPDYRETLDPAAPNGTFAGYFVIGGHSEVNLGIYLANDLSEAIVVDDRSAIFERLYNNLTFQLATATQEGRAIDQVALGAVQQIALQAMRYSQTPSYKAPALQDLHGIPLVSLNFYLQVRSGAARHILLLAAYLMERLIKREVIAGSLYIDNALSNASNEKESLSYRETSGIIRKFLPAQEGLKPQNTDFNPFID